MFQTIEKSFITAKSDFEKLQTSSIQDLIKSFSNPEDFKKLGDSWQR